MIKMRKKCYEFGNVSVNCGYIKQYLSPGEFNTLFQLMKSVVNELKTKQPCK